jgi:flagellar L-ring protein FlgH
MGVKGLKAMSIFSILIAGAVCLSSCAGQAPVQSYAATPHARPAVAYTAQPPAPRTSAEGSLWDDSGDLSRMFINAKAHRIGDILTVRIVEASNAANKASTKTERSSSMSAGLNTFFNAEKRFPADQPFFNPFGKVGASIDSEFDGAGSTARSGALNAFMTARIVDILPNGNLAIEGNREVRVNHENQIITLTGLVRPRDISADNIVQSTYIADARISYSGTGIINDRQKPGWFTRIMDVVWPF